MKLPKHKSGTGFVTNLPRGVDCWIEPLSSGGLRVRLTPRLNCIVDFGDKRLSKTAVKEGLLSLASYLRDLAKDAEHAAK